MGETGDNLFARTDVNFGPKNRLMLRASYDDRKREGVNVGGLFHPEAGFVVRAPILRRVAKGALTVTDPKDPTVNAVIGGLAPGMQLAVHESADAATLALGTEPVDFRAVSTSALTRSEDGSFVSAPVTLSIPIPNPGGGGSGVTVVLKEAVLSGALEGGVQA